MERPSTLTNPETRGRRKPNSEPQANFESRRARHKLTELRRLSANALYSCEML